MQTILEGFPVQLQSSREHIPKCSPNGSGWMVSLDLMGVLGKFVKMMTKENKEVEGLSRVKSDDKKVVRVRSRWNATF